MGALKTTPLTGYEIELGAKMTPRAGWNTALYYPEGIIAEHRHTRSACSVFDLCSYGKLRVAGKEAAPALDTLFARPAADLGIGRCRRNFMLSETGGVLSLVLMLRMAEDDFLLVSDTGSAAGDLERISAHIAGRDAEVQELTPLLACLGLEGPEARKVLESFAAGPLPEYSCCGTVEIDGFRAIAACAGATGEEGFRLLFNLEYADQLWDLLLETEPVMPAGFGALDSLRLEMGYPACGRELTAEFSPLDSGLGDLVRLQRVERADHLEHRRSCPARRCAQLSGAAGAAEPEAAPCADRAAARNPARRPRGDACAECGGGGGRRRDRRQFLPVARNRRCAVPPRSCVHAAAGVRIVV